MKTKILMLLLGGGGGVVGAGWIETVDGRSQAGVPWVKDSVEGRYEVPAARVFDAAKQVLAFNGTVTGENTINHSLEAKVNQTSVFVRVDDLDPAKPLTHVIVQTRTKGGGSDLDLAHEMEKQIALKLVR